jgi:hypothetical protein
MTQAGHGKAQSANLVGHLVSHSSQPAFGEAADWAAWPAGQPGRRGSLAGGGRQRTAQAATRVLGDRKDGLLDESSAGWSRGQAS